MKKKNYTLLPAFFILFSCSGGLQDAYKDYSLSTHELKWIITTFAGTGTASYSGDGGTATSATLYNPKRVTVDILGNVYIADTYNNCIRKVNTGGIISTVAGDATWGYSGDGGAATSAQLKRPGGVAVDNQGSIYISDTQNHRIRKVNTAGIISTLAGTGTPSYSGDGGPATSATLNSPEGIAIDISGNLYIADAGNHRIRKIDTGGIISTLAGDGTIDYSTVEEGAPATSASLNYPSGIAIDAANNLYIADFNNNRIRKVNSNGDITTFAGIGTGGYSGDSGPATSAMLKKPTDVAVDSSNCVYIVDYENARIRKVDGEGNIVTFAGPGTTNELNDGSPPTEAWLYYPIGIAIGSNGNIYIADTDNKRIRKVSLK